MIKSSLYLCIATLTLSAAAYAGDLVEDPVFKAKCAMCHGASAEGREKMKTPPLKDRANRSADELTKAIEDGNDKQTPKMPAFKEKLSPDEIKTLVAEIKSLK